MKKLFNKFLNWYYGKIIKVNVLPVVYHGVYKRGKTLGYPPQPKFPRHCGKTSRYFPPELYNGPDDNDTMTAKLERESLIKNKLQ